MCRAMSQKHLEVPSHRQPASGGMETHLLSDLLSEQNCKCYILNNVFVERITLRLTPPH